MCVRATHAPAPAPLCLQVPRKVPHRDASSTTNANLRGCNMAQSRSVRHASLHPSIVEIPCRHLSVPALAISPRLICNTNVVVVIGLTHCSGCHLSSPTLLVTIHPHPYSRVPGENSAPFASRATHDFGLHVSTLDSSHTFPFILLRNYASAPLYPYTARAHASSTPLNLTLAKVGWTR